MRLSGSYLPDGSALAFRVSPYTVTQALKVARPYRSRISPGHRVSPVSIGYGRDEERRASMHRPFHPPLSNCQRSRSASRSHRQVQGTASTGTRQ